MNTGRPRKKVRHLFTNKDWCSLRPRSIFKHDQITTARCSRSSADVNVLCLFTARRYQTNLLMTVDSFNIAVFSALEHSHVSLHESLVFYSAFLNIHRSGVLTALTWLVPHETAAVSARSVSYQNQMSMEQVSKVHDTIRCSKVTSRSASFPSNSTYML